MSKKPWRNKVPGETPIQKYSWKKIKIYDTYNEANKRRDELKSAGNTTKIKRCGRAGTKFKVLTGEKIEKTHKKK
jgi:hypothetical protein